MKLVAIDIQTVKPVITDNFEDVEASLLEGLKQYDLVVGEDDLKDAKTKATELNQLKQTIKDLKKTKIAEMSTPIKEWGDKADKLSQHCENARQKILKQVKEFEDHKRANCLKLLQKELNHQYRHNEIRDEFKTVKVDDLAILSNLTKTGVSKKAVDAISDRVSRVKLFQEKIDNRLASLSAICIERGLTTPLKEENVKHFLMDDDSSYNGKLNSLIQSEIARLVHVHQPVKEVVTQQTVVSVQQHHDTTSQSQNLSINELQQLANGDLQPANCPSDNQKVTYTVTATFTVTVEEKLEPKLEATLINKFKDGGFKQVPTINIYKN